MSNSQHIPAERDSGRWMALYAVIVAVLATVLDGALMGLIAPAVKQDLGADAATIGLMSAISMLMLAAFIFGGGTLGDIYLKVNSGDVAAQFGITVQQLEGVIAQYQHAFTSGVSQVLWISASVAAIGAVLAWFSFGKK